MNQVTYFIVLIRFIDTITSVVTSFNLVNFLELIIYASNLVVGYFGKSLSKASPIFPQEIVNHGAAVKYVTLQQTTINL